MWIKNHPPIGGWLMTNDKFPMTNNVKQKSIWRSKNEDRQLTAGEQY
jgi:hypothetical protein